MERYKVIEEFGIAQKGDVFDKVQLDDEVVYVMEREEELNDGDLKAMSYSGMTLDEDTMEKRIEMNQVKVIEDTEDEADDTLVKVEEYIDSLVEQYETDHKVMLESFEKGEIQPCVKVEAETVYFNLIKVLNAIKDKINE